MVPNESALSPILARKHYHAPSAFTPDSLLREARRQKGLPLASVPKICILDPDGDIVRHLLTARRAHRDSGWACYHTEVYAFSQDGHEFGIVPCAVGASYAVLVAEELFACGCRFLISVTSSGQVRPIADPPYFIVIESALRDEGTSYHYLPPSEYSRANPILIDMARATFGDAQSHVGFGATWTTDAPFRETQEAIDAAAKDGILAVEMEAAALYAFAQARQQSVLCLAHVTNQMGRIEGDFEKGAAAGAQDALQVIALIAGQWLSLRR